MNMFENFELNNIKKQYRAIILGTFIFALVAHGSGIFNKYSFGDDVFYFFGEGATFESGRWMLGLLGQIARFIYQDNLISAPVFESMLAFCLIAATGVLLVNFLKIENTVLCFLLGGLMVVYPVITGLFGYVFTFSYYMIALFLAVLGGCLMVQSTKWYGILGGILCAACSAGIYQAYIPVVFCTMLFGLMQDAAFSDRTTLSVIKKSLAALGYIIVFLLLYLAINKFFLKLYDIQLTDYQDINSMGFQSLRAYKRRIGQTLYDCLGLTSPSIFIPKIYPGWILYLRQLMIALSLVLIMIQAIRIGKKDILRGVGLVGFFFVFLAAANIIMVMVDPFNVHMLMVYGQAMLFVLFVWLVEKIALPNVNLDRVFKRVCVLLIVAVVILYCRFDNKCHINSEIRKSQLASYCTTLITQIKSTDGYSDDYPVVFVRLQNATDKSIYEMDEFVDLNLPNFGGTVLNQIGGYAFLDYLRIWHSYCPQTLPSEEYEELPEVEEMPSYPKSGSIRVLNNTVIVKMAEQSYVED